MSADAAQNLAQALANDTRTAPPDADGRPRSRRLVMGDPQAPLPAVLAILDGHGLLGADGWLRPDVGLLSVGDHFDWGRVSDREAATADGTALLAWLAAHPPDQVVILAGNHDLGRVGELADIDMPTYAAARDEATSLYGRGHLEREAAFLARYPMFPSVEVAARDFSAFSVEQRDLVASLLRSRRLRLGWAEDPELLVVHAGVTEAELAAAGLPPSERQDARQIAGALNAALDAAISSWSGGALAINGVHQPGNAATGEGGGALYHRPANPQIAAIPDPTDSRRRRYDPRALPRGVTQVIGHVRDGKCRSMLGDWADAAPARDGVLRHLRTDGRRVAYAHGTAAPAREEAALLFLDAGMQYIPPDTYPLLDISTRTVASRRPPWVSF